jgi:hypothetical protein
MSIVDSENGSQTTQVVKSGKARIIENNLSAPLSSNSVRIYPNPNVGIFTIDLNSTESTIIEIRNTLGEVLFIQEFSLQSKIEINATDYGKGIFFAKVSRANGEILTKKIIIN